ncbi:hypothetical protein F5X68DRAFT_205995 [Plectosphaerella plurivora]|uniref:DUF7136 domain-containing protein n=1 Tax=Plectosphaerella plurivora TaxID=936078 RepID=A0A9P8VFG4_9PEZI|nr:hypothetical protein F5X68DRAFT_205995 [Plectosphaerella plurivora]
MSPSSSVWTLLLGTLSLLLANVCAARLDPDITQVDLIFPRNGSTYRPVYPFPFVLAVTNAHLVWPYRFIIDWQVNSHNEERKSFAYGSTGPGHYSYNVDDQISPDQPLLLTWGSNQFINTTKTRFSIHLSMSVDHICPPNGTLDNDIRSVVHNHVVFFGLSADGDLPDMEAGGPEPEHIGAFRLTGVGELETQLNKPCPFMEETPGVKGPVDPSAFVVDGGVADLVEARMLEEARCNGTGQSWPNATGMLDWCPKREDSSGAYCVPAGVLLTFGTATLAVILGFVWL